MKQKYWFVCLLITTILFVYSTSGPVLAQEEPHVSMIFVQDDLRDAITELVLQTGINIIVDDSVHGLVTLDLIDVPLEQALQMMSIAGGYEVHKLDGFYFIGSSDPSSSSYRNFAKSESYHLKYLDARDAVDLIPEIYQRYIRAGYTSNIITITAPPVILEDIRELLEMLDQPAQQILVQALVTEISKAELEEWGSGLLSYTPTSEDNSWIDYIAYENSVLNFGLFNQVLASLRALEAEQKAEIKANPRVITSSGKTVDLFSGETHFFVMAQDSSSSRRLEEIDVGVSLNVTPQVVDGDVLRIAINPEISHLSGGSLTNGNSFSVRRSSVSTNVFAKNGQTLLLAGMTLQQASNEQSKVPVLGSIPIIRWFFSEKSNSNEERELLIFITAEILTDEAQTIQ